MPDRRSYALNLVALMGGIARIVWDNGGQVGVVDGKGKGNTGHCSFPRLAVSGP